MVSNTIELRRCRTNFELLNVCMQLVATDTGTLEVHMINRQFSALMDDEVARFTAFVNKFV